MHFRIQHDFEIDAASYWEMFFSADYTEELYRSLKMRDWKILDEHDDGKTLRRTVRMTPAQQVPTIFQSVIKDTSYTEHDIFHRERSSMDVTIEPAIMRDKFDMRGIYSVQPLGEGRCRRVWEGDCKVSIMLLGGKIEKYMVDEMHSSYSVATDVTRRWIDKRKRGSAA
jgi:hypothetical protein